MDSLLESPFFFIGSSLNKNKKERGKMTMTMTMTK